MFLGYLSEKAFPSVAVDFSPLHLVNGVRFYPFPSGTTLSGRQGHRSTRRQEQLVRCRYGCPDGTGGLPSINYIPHHIHTTFSHFFFQAFVFYSGSNVGCIFFDGFRDHVEPIRRKAFFTWYALYFISVQAGHVAGSLHSLQSRHPRLAHLDHSVFWHGFS